MTQNIGEGHFMDETDEDNNLFYQVKKEKK
jgi:hypothetical protein